MAATNTWIDAGDVRITGEGLQQAPASAALAGGGSIVVWIDANGDGEVHGQRLDAAGNKVGGRLLLSQGPAAGIPDVVGVADGGFVVVWDSRLDPFAPTSYLAQRFDAGGTPIGGRVQANTLPNFDPAAAVDVTALAGGGFVVQWWQDPGGATSWGPSIQVCDATGAPRGGNLRLGYEGDGTPFGAGTYIHDASVAPTADGGFVVAWATTQVLVGAGTIDHVYLQRFDAGGGALAGPVEAFAHPGSVLSVDGVQATVLPGSGDVVISARGVLPDGRSELTAQRFNADGQALSGPQAVVSAAAVLDSKVTALADDGFVLSWMDSAIMPDLKQQQTVYAQLLDASGALVGARILVGTSQATLTHYTVNATADGGVEFAWDDGRGDGGDVFSSKFTPSVSGDHVLPTVVAFSPADEARDVAVDANIVATFSEAIQRGTGTIVLQDSAGRVLAAYDAATSSNIRISGATLTIDPGSSLQPATGYAVVLASGSVIDLAGNPYAGTSSYNFTTTGAAPAPNPASPTPIDFFPVPGSSTMPPDWNLAITFSEAVKAGSGTITLQTATGAVVQTFVTASDAGIQFSGASLIINPAADLLPGTTYRLVASADAVRDLDGNPYAGESGYSFTTAGAAPGPAPAPNPSSPVPIDFFPVPGSSTMPPDWSLGITFNEAVKAGSGTITLQTATGAVVQTFVTASDAGIQFSGASLVINPAADLLPGTTYRLVASPDAVRDLDGNPYAGESGYSFTTAGAAPAPNPSSPVPIDFFPVPGSSTMPPDWSLGITFNEAVKAGSGSITLQTAAGAVVQTFVTASDPGIQFSGSSLIINPAADLLPGTTYQLVASPDAVRDLDDNPYAGESGYSFTTAGSQVATLVELVGTGDIAQAA
ncbi:hypothetical protein RAMLITH_12950 [Ramlibacter sp. RBP-2]|uniref:SbsA Ig-like domain-containing protein n=1 Tax=Ramlibacter lithotrophicus TaxID=2606681 RepID=A0A7X6DGI6_9BURK|nr:Ig-like domain-containing protein [Ramlibacter lithotrophicus]NKE66735.1 hypothetical protein [Ramlibacter lithotrophicus]